MIQDGATCYNVLFLIINISGINDLYLNDNPVLG